MILGLGAGWNEPEFRSYGIPFDDRFDRFEDGLRIIAAMLRSGRSTHPGTVSRTDSARLAPRGPRPDGLPIMVGATGPRMLRLTAELADHWNGGLRLANEAAPLLARVDEACRAAGREPATMTRSVEVLVRSIPAADGLAPEERELRGTADELVAALRTYAALGLDHLQVQLRPNTAEAVRAFRPILEGLAVAGSVAERSRR